MDEVLYNWCILFNFIYFRCTRCFWNWFRRFWDLKFNPCFLITYFVWFIPSLSFESNLLRTYHQLIILLKHWCFNLIIYSCKFSFSFNFFVLDLKCMIFSFRNLSSRGNTATHWDDRLRSAPLGRSLLSAHKTAKPWFTTFFVNASFLYDFPCVYLRYPFFFRFFFFHFF